MKTLYETILDSTGSGKSKFNFDNITGYTTFNNFSDIFNMMKVKRALKDEFMVPYDIKRASDSKLIAILLTQFEYTKPEIELLKKEGTEISKVFKQKVDEFLHKKTKDKFEFSSYHGIDGWEISIKPTGDGLPIGATTPRTIFYYDLNR